MESNLTLPIETERLRLRDFVIEDFAAIYAYASDPEVTKHMFYGPRNETDTQEYLQRMLECQRQRPRMTWELGIVERNTNRLIGACDLTLDEEGSGDLGYIFGREVWGHGYASEAATAMVQAGFDQLKVKRIYAVCEVERTCSRGGLLLEPAKNGHFFPSSRTQRCIFCRKNGHTFCSASMGFNRPGIFPWIFAFFLAFRSQYFISPTPERPQVEHRASAQVLEQAGLRWVRTEIRYYEAKGRWWDMELYELWSTDWEKDRQVNLH